MVERHLAKVDVAGPTPVSRSMRRRSGENPDRLFFVDNASDTLVVSGALSVYVCSRSREGSPSRRGRHVVVTKNIEKLEHSSVKLTVTVGKDDVRAAYEAIVKDYSKNVRIDGFRKGKVPATILERKFGSQLKLDAMGRVMDEAVEKALEGETLVPLSYAQPSLAGEPQFELDADFSFSVI